MIRAGWAAVGILCVGLGAIGIVIPGVPTTVFFIAAAACFARSSPRMEAWVLNLPTIGPAVADYRAGRGMRRTAKVLAITMMGVAVTVSAWLLPSWPLRLIVVALGVVGSGRDPAHSHRVDVSELTPLLTDERSPSMRQPAPMAPGGE